MIFRFAGNYTILQYFLNEASIWKERRELVFDHPWQSRVCVWLNNKAISARAVSRAGGRVAVAANGGCGTLGNLFAAFFAPRSTRTRPPRSHGHPVPAIKQNNKRSTFKQILFVHAAELCANSHPCITSIYKHIYIYIYAYSPSLLAQYNRLIKSSITLLLFPSRVQLRRLIFIQVWTSVSLLNQRRTAARAALINFCLSVCCAPAWRSLVEHTERQHI